MDTTLQARLQELAAKYAAEVQQIIRSVPLQELVGLPQTQQPARRGRPKGSKNKPAV